MNEDDRRNIALYRSLLTEHGDSYRSLDWGSSESQIKRFEILADIGIRKDDSLLDVGCGLADFYEWLQCHRPGVNYSGIDITPEMIERAKVRFPGVKFSNSTIFDMDISDGTFDYLCASGIFFYREEDPKGYMFKVISRMFNASRKGIAFNSLSEWSTNKLECEFYADPFEVLNFCREMSPYVTLRHDYHAGDFTVYIHRKKQ